jgi:hypothetical protein
VTDRVLVGRNCADEDIPDVLGVDIGVFPEFDLNFLVKRIDEEIEDLVLGEFIGCLVWLHHLAKQSIHLTGFVNY